MKPNNQDMKGGKDLGDREMKRGSDTGEVDTSNTNSRNIKQGRGVTDTNRAASERN